MYTCLRMGKPLLPPPHGSQLACMSSEMRKCCETRVRKWVQKCTLPKCTLVSFVTTFAWKHHFFTVRAPHACRAEGFWWWWMGIVSHSGKYPHRLLTAPGRAHSHAVQNPEGFTCKMEHRPAAEGGGRCLRPISVPV